MGRTASHHGTMPATIGHPLFPKPRSGLTDVIENFLKNGLAFVSMDYRLVATKYYYDTSPAGGHLEEEYIHADADGRLTLDTESAPSSSYAVRIGRQALAVEAHA